MTNSALAKNAYGNPMTPVRSERTTEYQAFARVTGLLKAAQEDPKDFATVADAVYRNRKLWTILALDLAQDSNELPEKLRADMLGLANFSIKHGSKVLSGEADLTALIDINTSIMRGLRSATGA